MNPQDHSNPEHLSTEQSAVIARRRRGRNWALLGVLTGCAVLFYLITLTKLRNLVGG
jgi:hypothetical protein